MAFLLAAFTSAVLQGVMVITHVHLVSPLARIRIAVRLHAYIGCFRNLTVWRVLRKRLHLKAYKLSIVQHHYKVLFETPCITSGSHIEP
jgi:hypothetical protein